MKQTAVDWLYEILHKQNYIYEDMSEYLKQAKEMEKQQIIEAYNEAENNCEYFIEEHKWNRYYETSEGYYKHTFKK